MHGEAKWRFKDNLSLGASFAIKTRVNKIKRLCLPTGNKLVNKIWD